MRSERMRKLAPANKDLAYRVGRYPRALFRQEINEPGDLRDAIDARKNASSDGHDQWLLLMREVYGRLLGIDTAKLGAPDETAAKLHGVLESLPEWEQVQREVQNDPFLTGVATAKVSGALSPHVPTMQDLEAAKRQLEATIASGAAERFCQEAARRVERIEAAVAAFDAKLADPHQIRAAARDGLLAASEEVAGVALAIAGLGADLAPPGSPQRIAAVQMLRTPDTRLIAQMAGRLRTTTRRKAGEKGYERGSSEVVAVERGGDLERLLPGELSLMGDPDLEPLLFARMLERQALQYELCDPGHAESGPILFLLDESGSMTGDRNVYAKAIALGMIERAIAEQRSFALVHFSTGAPNVEVFPDPGQPDMALLRRAVEGFRSGGTDLEGALVYAFSLLSDPDRWPDGRVWPDASDADVVLVTDGIAFELKEGAAEVIRRAEAKLYTISIMHETPEWLRAVSCESTTINDAAVRAGDFSGVQHLFG